MRDGDGHEQRPGPYVQVSRLGNPLVNEVIVPMGYKDEWNAGAPADDAEFAKYVAHPELATLLPVLYPGVFPNLAACVNGRPRRPGGDPADGDPRRDRAGFQNYTGHDAGRPAAAEHGDPAAADAQVGRHPRRRPRRLPERPPRPTDDVVTIELRAVARATVPARRSQDFIPDAAAAALYDVTDTAIPTR